VADLQAEQAVRVYFTNYLAAEGRELTSPSSISFNEVSEKKFDRILENFSVNLRLRNYARKTEKTYIYWSKQFLFYAHSRSAKFGSSVEISSEAVKDFLAHLAIKRHVSASTQNQAFNALLSFFRLTLNQDLGDLRQSIRAKTGKRPHYRSCRSTDSRFTQTSRSGSGSSRPLSGRWFRNCSPS